MKKINYIILICLMYFLNTSNSFSQVSTYTFSQSIGVFNSIHSTGTYISGSCGGSTYGNLPTGFTFFYNGVPYTHFGMCCNGWISMGSVTPVNSTVPLSSGVTNNVIVPFAQTLASTVAGNGIFYKVDGNAPNRILTVEWWQYGFWFNGFDEVSFQIKLMESTNQIQLVYTTNDIYSIRNIQVGLRGNTSSDFNNRSTITNWEQTISGIQNSSTCLFQSGCTPPSGLTFTFTPPVSGLINLNEEVPNVFKLYQNFPNPFNPLTKIKFDVSEYKKVFLRIYDIKGKTLEILVDKFLRPGTYEINFNGGEYSSGIYYYQLRAGDYIQTKKFVLIK